VQRSDSVFLLERDTRRRGLKEAVYEWTLSRT
jgi:hypothetical protein